MRSACRDHRPAPVEAQGPDEAQSAPTLEEYRDRAASLYEHASTADAVAELMWELHDRLRRRVVEVWGEPRAKRAREALRLERRMPLGWLVEALIRMPDDVVPALATLLERVGYTAVPAEGKPEADLPVEAADTVSAAAALNAVTIKAGADGQYTEQEIGEMEDHAARMEREVADYRERLRQLKHAGIKARVEEMYRPALAPKAVSETRGVR